MNFPWTYEYIYYENLCNSTPEGYFQWSGSRIVKSDFKSDGVKLDAI